MHRHRHGSSWRKLPPRYARLLMPLVLSVFMSALVSAVATVASVGPGAAFAAHWPGAWGMSWVAAFPALLLAMPLARRLVALVAAEQCRPGECDPAAWWWPRSPGGRPAHPARY
ncbi:DUF2798 domain-containing protein [Stappia sp.]|uniref:DUF2798 domain-containing protein n=1 Tax=Stappia sp. TaxID=1870903 RepID=UPI003A99297B